MKRKGLGKSLKINGRNLIKEGWMAEKFFSRLSYSFGNEDWRSEQEALKIKTGDRVLSITASGDRPLHLLLDDCEEIVSIDANPIQNHLLNLKCVAMQHLSYKEYIEFLGAVPARKQRLHTFQKLLPHFEEKSRHYWINKKKMIEKGVLYQGVVEKKCQSIVAPLLRILRGKKVDKLFEFSDLKEQQEFVKKAWDKVYWRKLFDLSLNSALARLLLRCIVSDPGLYNHLNGATRVGSYLYRRMHNSLMHNLAKESLLFSLIFKGKVAPEAFPPYLTQEGVSIIKKRTHRLKVKNIDVVTFLETSPANSFDCFSLSDVASYLSPKNFAKMMQEVLRVAKPQARFSIRQFLSNHQLPENLVSSFARDGELEDRLEKKDRCFVYRYMAGTISK
ncbi:hypothetical protein DB41_AA00110 [Neochlamydia sp. TUME1]|nr:hypothetical protein DB41_AA00110 [Neochlamydia sp. TUME1]